jgi:5-methylcytosine-specific restriction endonuclease McrA
MIKLCIICKKEFIHKHRAYRQICCSPECSLAHKKIYRSSEEFKIRDRELKNKYMIDYRKTTKYKTTHARLGKKYKQTKKYKLWEKNYIQREDVKSRQKKSQNTNSYKQWRKEWCKGPVGKIICTRSRIKRRSIKNNYIETYTEAEWQNKVKATNGFCSGVEIAEHYVGVDNLTRDHDYPISEASKDFLKTGIKRIYTIDNMKPLCMACNSRKHTKIIEQILVPIIIEESNPKHLNTQVTNN